MQNPSNKDATWSKERMERIEEINEPVSTRISNNNILTPKVTTFSKALQYVGIKWTLEECEVDTNSLDNAININPLKRGWAAHPCNSKFNPNKVCIKKLIQLYNKGKRNSNKNYRVTTERAYDIVRNEIIPNGWTQKMIPFVPKIKLLFKNFTDGMDRLLKKFSNIEDEEALEESEIWETNNLRSIEDCDTLKDN